MANDLFANSTLILRTHSPRNLTGAIWVPETDYSEKLGLAVIVADTFTGSFDKTDWSQSDQVE
ncbi:MAG: hypothetical protein AAF623_04820 [Planctomycetota bacterium]